MRVLNVDDRSENRYLLEVQFRSSGWDVISAHNGAHALEILEHEPVDVIISDILMPQMDGYQLCREVKRRPNLRGTPFVFYTATYTDRRDEELALALGASCFVRKPTDPDEFARIIRAAVVQGREGPTPVGPTTEDEVVVLKMYNERLVQKLDRKVAQLETTQARLHEAVAAGRVGLWDWDLRTNEVQYSQEWKRQLGYEDHEISNAFSEWETRVHPDDRDAALQNIRTFLEGNEKHLESELRLRHKDGSYRRILARGTDMRDDADRRIRIVGSHVDITERAELQARYLQAQKLESVGRLAGGVAHDFNNLLTTILGYAELVYEGLAPSNPLRHDVNEIRKAGNRAASITRQLLVFCRSEVPQRKVLDLNAIVGDMEKMVGRLLGEDVLVRVNRDPTLGRILADQGQIEQVILNLCVNARDAMPRGGALDLETANVDVDTPTTGLSGALVPGRYVVLTVRDTGTGMSSQVLSHIFEPFFTTKDVGKGTGLGLATVYGIIDGVGGHVAVDSEVDRGSSFRVYLPRVDIEADVPVAPPPARRGSESVLLVEDDDLLRELTRTILESHGYRVVDAANGAAALRASEQQVAPFDLLVTDIVMPGMSGRELAERLTTIRPGLRVLYCSGYTNEPDVREEIAGSSRGYLQKPYVPQALLRKVREILDAPIA